jgi:hypothetical protein
VTELSFNKNISKFFKYYFATDVLEIMYAFELIFILKSDYIFHILSKIIQLL